MTSLPITKGEQAHDKAMAAIRALTVPIRPSARIVEETRNQWIPVRVPAQRGKA